MNEQTALVLGRLQGGALASLISLVIDDVLQRPVATLIDAESVARQVTNALDVAARSARTEAWLREQITALRGQVPPGTPGDRLPAEVRDPLRAVIGKPIVLDRVLVGRMLQHAAVERLLRDIIGGAVRGFAKKVSAFAPPPAAAEAAKAGLGRLKAFAGVKGLSEGVLGGLSQEIEHRAEQKIRDFVDEALHVAMRQMADHAASAEHAEAYAAWRVHLFETLIETDNRILAREVEKLDPDRLVDMGAATVRSLAARPDTQADVAGIVRAAIEALGDRSLSDVLRETGLEESAGIDAEAAWRREVESQLVARGQDILATPAFGAWLDGLLAP
jgi:hypothetical protein